MPSLEDLMRHLAGRPVYAINKNPQASTVWQYSACGEGDKVIWTPVAKWRFAAGKRGREEIEDKTPYDLVSEDYLFFETLEGALGEIQSRLFAEMKSWPARFLALTDAIVEARKG